MQNYYNIPNVLVGINTPYIHSNFYIDKETDLDWSPEWPLRPILGTGRVDYQEFPRSTTSVFLESNTQANNELVNEYSQKSMMSLDGLFSPVSFYPTPYSATFAITKFPTPNCPFCFGTKVYEYSLQKDFNAYGAMAAQNFRDNLIQKSRPCPFCETIESKDKKKHIGTSSREVMPPYIIASGKDANIIAQMPMSGINQTPIINYATLNPIVLSIGEFSNVQNKQSGDYSGHSIDLVSFGQVPPAQGDGLRPSYSRNINKSFVDYDINTINLTNELSQAAISVAPIPAISNNMRFFGLRGPIILHSWGYDTEGFPVPNSSGEPLTNNGVVVRDKDNNIVGRNQQPVSGVSGVWTKPYKESTFYKGWAQQPGSWPVGPIDLRWDENAGVWTIGANYKTVHIVIEEDMVDTNPARGVILDSPTDSSPLPSGLRKLVFIKDSLGMYSAPRGAALYCKYNSDNGFYEPIGYRPFITSGLIESYNTAKIFKIYSTKKADTNIKTSDDQNLESYSAIYKNPLSYQVSIGGVGLFTFMNGYWVLHAFNSN